MPDPIYVDSLTVSVGPFTVKTDRRRGVVIRRQAPAGRWTRGMSLAELELLHEAIGEYLHMRSME